MAAPYILETKRLWLRPFAPQDTDVLHRLFTDPDVRRYLFDDKIVSRDRVDGEIEDSIASFARSGFGMWANHSLVMANYISRANAAVIDLRQLLSQG